MISTSNLKELLLTAAHNEASTYVWIIQIHNNAIVLGAYGQITITKKTLESVLNTLVDSDFCSYELKYQCYKVTVLSLLE